MDRLSSKVLLATALVSGLGYATNVSAEVRQDSQRIFRAHQDTALRPGAAGFDPTLNGGLGGYKTGIRVPGGDLIPINTKPNRFGDTGFFNVEWNPGTDWSKGAELFVPVAANFTTMGFANSFTANVFGVVEMVDYGTNTATGDTILGEDWNESSLTWHNAAGIVGDPANPGDSYLNKYDFRSNFMPNDPPNDDGKWQNGFADGTTFADPVHFSQGGEFGGVQTVFNTVTFQSEDRTNNRAGHDPDQAVFLGTVEIRRPNPGNGDPFIIDFKLKSAALDAFMLADTNNKATFILNAYQPSLGNQGLTNNNAFVVSAEYDRPINASNPDDGIPDGFYGLGVRAVPTPGAALGTLAGIAMVGLRRRR